MNNKLMIVTVLSPSYIQNVSSFLCSLAVTCPEINRHPFSRLDLRQVGTRPGFRYDNTASVVCNEGFTLLYTTPSTCTNPTNITHGEWDPRLPDVDDPMQPCMCELCLMDLATPA